MSSSYIATLQAERDRLVATHDRVATRLAARWEAIEPWQRLAVGEDLAAYRQQISALEQQVAWETRMAGVPDAHAPLGPAWSN